MKIYLTDPNIDDICELGKTISLNECSNCKYCKELHRIIKQGHIEYMTNIYLKIECDYENNTISS